jgi:hypothetical protein
LGKASRPGVDGGAAAADVEYTEPERASIAGTAAGSNGRWKALSMHKPKAGAPEAWKGDSSDDDGAAIGADTAAEATAEVERCW